jgi:molecular chaperone GrpE (heat shock protein)
MLAELAAANAAFDVIKQSIQNGKEIYEAGEAVAEYFGLKTEIQKKAHEHGYKSDLQAFMAAEQLKKQEEELKNMMIYQGRGGMWDDWLKFQSDMKKSREEEERKRKLAKAKRKKALINSLIITSAVIGTSALIAAGIYLLITFGK